MSHSYSIYFFEVLPFSVFVLIILYFIQALALSSQTMSKIRIDLTVICQEDVLQLIEHSGVERE